MCLCTFCSYCTFLGCPCFASLQKTHSWICFLCHHKNREMDEAGGKTEKREMLPAEDHQYAFFDHSHSYVTAFHPKEAQLGNFEHTTRMAIDALERARARESKTNSSVVHTLDGGPTSETSDEDFEEMNSDAESRHEGSSVDAVLKEKRVRRKLEVLAQMVGVDSEKPGVVLDEVVRVLRDLERNVSQL